MDSASTLKDQEANPIADEGFLALRELLLGDQIREVDELRRRLDDPRVRSQETSRVFAEALSMADHRDQKTRTALHPIVEESLRTSVEKNPALLAGVLFPIVGQAVRKAVAHSLQHMFDSLNSTLDGKVFFKRFRWRVEAMRSGKSFGEIALIRSLAYRVEHVYLIHRKTGLLLAEQGRNPSLLGDADLVVGMLTALQDFVKDSFTAESQDDLEVMQVGEFKVWLQHGPLAILAVVVRGQLPLELRKIFARTIEEIHTGFHSQLVAYETIGQPIPGIGAGLDACLLGDAPAGKQTYTKFKVAAGVLFAIILSGLFVYVRDGLRWEHYLTALRREPGVVVIEAHRNLSKFSVAGLHDPMARDPRLLLSEFHLSDKKIFEYWEGYQSLDPRFASKRRLDAEADAVRRSVVRFELDSSTIPAEQLPFVDIVSDQIRQLSFDAALQNRQVRVKIFGHTDSTGTEGRNAKLSQERAEEMVRMLVSRGVDPVILSAAGLGDKQPLQAGADLYRQNLDRRVTFALSFSDTK